ncbi:thymidine kinase [Cryptosporangium aurantiacum]|uniref:Thymidine kinase n=1 Tax=Cryptosporangium aurantiacum TaxID=134849 RepID=A0A1M7RIC9_9ACTN|nr:thymidine kinase [Cryptosporangium aurantiacum]SHN46017.1 thymidine kinase [Cryptosporangium aurantiacum]
MASARSVRVPTGSPGTLRFFYGPMDCGKSTLALQINHNHARQGRHGLLLTKLDRAGTARISSRVGLTANATEVLDGTDLHEVVRGEWSAGRRVDYLICDEAQFYAPEQIEQAADLADGAGIDVYAFGLATDFRSELFPGSRRLFELADELIRLQVEVLCWCGRPGQQNARVVDGVVTRTGDQILVADTASAGQTAAPPEVRYQVLCRRHYREGDLGPATPSAGQLALGTANGRSSSW